MADNDQNNDEYKFSDLDSYDTESVEDSKPFASESTSAGQSQTSGQKDVKKNALIVIGIVLLLMVTYKFIGYFFSGKSEPGKDTIPPLTKVIPQPEPPLDTSAPIQQAQPIENIASQELKEKIATIEASQNDVKSQVNSVNDKLSDVNNTVNNLNTQISRLNQVLENLTSQAARQSNELSVLMAARNRPKPARLSSGPRQTAQQIYYSIQAVIPGRAWLIGSNGSTLTVREGTRISGYGVVKLIDSLQGRVLTSSGRIIRFSQEDS